MSTYSYEQPHEGVLVVNEPYVEAIPSADGFVAYVPVMPSPRYEVRAYGERGDAEVVWSPERGWLCSVHTAQPCEHTAGLSEPGKR